jgi:hypothetical protein
VAAAPATAAAPAAPAREDAAAPGKGKPSTGDRRRVLRKEEERPLPRERRRALGKEEKEPLARERRKVLEKEKEEEMMEPLSGISLDFNNMGAQARVGWKVESRRTEMESADFGLILKKFIFGML